MSPGLEILQKLREEHFNKETERLLESHPYLKAAKDGTLTLSQRRAFAREQYSIQLSDATSFAFLAGHKTFSPATLAGAKVPDPVKSSASSKEESGTTADLFQFLLGGEVYAAPLLLAYAKSVGLDGEASLQQSSNVNSDQYLISAKAQAYPSYWARLALSGQRAAGAAACAVNFPAWGDMCRRLSEALSSNSEYGYTDGANDEGLAFINFFASPIEDLDLMAAAIIEEEGTSYEELVEPVRLLQEYEIMFWDAIFEKR
mmetsp:Transcript_22650/g.31623  ORF Transcript_22650/g.31623 Transcript_22650/m.31623 type:complete len:259 (+) Transcript_22650:125-901(+)